MATIYQLSERLSQLPRAVAMATTAEPATARSATVVLFTGVRYERWTDSAHQTTDEAADRARAHSPASGTSQR